MVLSFAVGSAMIRPLGSFRTRSDCLWAFSLAVMAGMVVLGPILLLIRKGRGRRASLFPGEGIWLAQLAPLILLLVVAYEFPRRSYAAELCVISACLLTLTMTSIGMVQLAVLALDREVDRRWMSCVGCLVALWPV